MKTNKYKEVRYTVEIVIAKSQTAVFNYVADLSKWWPEEFEGPAINVDTEFVLKTGDGHYSKNKVIEYVPGKKLTWLTTESLRKSDNFDWTGTKMIFELARDEDSTMLRFTYDGVVFEDEYGRLVQICDFTINEILNNYINTGKHDFTATIEILKSPKNVFEAITRDVAKWWGGNDLRGESLNLNDEFIIDHPGAHYSKQRLVEVIPNKKIVWLVTDSTLNWLKVDQHEWTNTKMIFELSAEGDKTILHFTHEGLVPEKECYSMCSQGWNTVIEDYLFNLVTYNRPRFLLNT